jgi:hypothetical protein
MFIKGVSHQLELIASIFSVYFLSAHCHTQEWFDRSDDGKGWYTRFGRSKRTRIPTIINEYQLVTLYINDFRQWSAFHIGIQLKRFAWLSTNHLIRLITLHLYVWHNIISNKRFHCPMSESLLLFKINSIEISRQCNMAIDLHNIILTDMHDDDKVFFYYYSSSSNASVIEHAMYETLLIR